MFLFLTLGLLLPLTFYLLAERRLVPLRILRLSKEQERTRLREKLR